MSRRLIFIAFALLISGATVFLAQLWMRGQLNGRDASAARAGRGPASVPAARVLVANVDLPTGTILRSDQLRWEVWPAASAVTYSVEGRARQSDFEGTVLRSHLAPGEPIVAGQVARPGERGFLAAVLAPGDNAVTINVTPSTGMAGFVVPGDRVDVLLTMTAPSTIKDVAPRHVSETLLSNLRVVGLDQSFTDQTKVERKEVVAPKTVTLEVTRKQAEVVEVASELGTLSLSLRSLGASAADAEPVGASETWDREATHLLSPQVSTQTRRRVGVIPARITYSVRVVRGAEVSDLVIPAALTREGRQP